MKKLRTVYIVKGLIAAVLLVLAAAFAAFFFTAPDVGGASGSVSLNCYGWLGI